MKGKSIILAVILTVSASLLTGCIIISSPKVTSSPSSWLVSSNPASSQVSSDSSSETASSSAAASSSETVSYPVYSGTEEITTGTFSSFEMGDYGHLYMTGEDNVEYNYIIMKYPGLDPESLVAGQKIKVTWMNVDEFITEAGGTFNIDLVIKIELVG